KYGAMEVMLTGATLTAQRAYELGIANKVVPAEMTIGIAKRIARELAAKPPLAVRLAKEAVLKAFEGPLSEGLAVERKSFYFLFATEDQKEGMHAFLEKRKGVFTGRCLVATEVEQHVGLRTHAGTAVIRINRPT